MSRVAVCPSEDTLAALLGGELTDSVSPRVALHALDCAECGLQLAAASPELLDQRYRLLRVLGEGGMGVVYEAYDVVLGEPVALKLLRAELARDERALESLKSEAKLSRQIGHEHVCRVFDWGCQSASGTTVHYLSMELLRGPSLRSLLASGALAPQLALRLADQVLTGLQAAHAAGVLHRDLKPDNILLRYPSPHEPHAVITDFGLARAFRAGQRHVTASRTLVGSAAYLAPEQVEDAPLTEATDLYGFGVVMFELLTGQQPFRGETALGIALKRLQVPPPPPSTLRPELGARYDAFVVRCMARDPRARFQRAVQARAALQALLEPAGESPSRRVRSATRAGVIVSFVCGASAWLGSSGQHDPNADAVIAEPLGAAQRPTLSLPRRAAEASSPAAGSVQASDGHASSDALEKTLPKAADRQQRPKRRNVLVAPTPATGASLSLRTAMPAGPSARESAAAVRPDPAHVLTPDGFLDPFAK